MSCRTGRPRGRPEGSSPYWADDDRLCIEMARRRLRCPDLTIHAAAWLVAPKARTRRARRESVARRLRNHYNASPRRFEEEAERIELRLAAARMDAQAELIRQFHEKMRFAAARMEAELIRQFHEKMRFDELASMRDSSPNSRNTFVDAFSGVGAGSSYWAYLNSIMNRK
jgi:hypothetical protein